jgi:quercetin dioxygenase-like cupin family protein
MMGGIGVGAGCDGLRRPVEKETAMSMQQLSNTHPTGRTTGTAERPGREHVGLAMTFDLSGELDRLRQEESWRRSGRNARTLVKEKNLRMVLMTMRGGIRVSEHQAAGRLVIQVLRGRLQLDVPDQSVDLHAGQLLALDFAVQYEITSHEESDVLLTLAWEGSQG